MSLRSITDCICKDTKDFDNKLIFSKKICPKDYFLGKRSVLEDSIKLSRVKKWEKNAVGSE
jgi:hypothetical protein